MNILVITQMYPQPDDAGANKPTHTVEYFCKEWVALGHNVVVIHCPSRFPAPYYFAPQKIKNKVAGKISSMSPVYSSSKSLHRKEFGVRIFREPLLKVVPGQSFSKHYLKHYTKKIVSLISNEGFVPDVVLGHFANPSLELAVNLAEIYHAKSSIVFHHDCVGNNIKKYRIDFNIEKIGAVGARSIVEANQIKSDLGLEDVPFICYSGVPNEIVKEAPLTCEKNNNETIKILTVGSLNKVKRIDSVLSAFAKITNTYPKAFSYEIAGDGNEYSSLYRMATELDILESVEFLGRISRTEVQKKMRDANVFALISQTETFGMVYMEAMLQGCITIASYGGGFDGIIKDGVNGFLCNPGDAEMLETIFEKILKLSPEERNAIGKRAIETARPFSEASVAQMYLDDVINHNDLIKEF